MDANNSPLDYQPNDDFLARYLQRIAYAGKTNNSLKCIATMMQQQLFAVALVNYKT